MSLFRRRQDPDNQELDTGDQAAPDPDASDLAGGAETGPDGGAGADRSNGPWDISERPDSQGMDFGSLILPPPPDDTPLELSLEFAQDGSTLVGLSLGTGTSGLQVLGFAAPRKGGLWAEVRAELYASLKEQGGVVSDTDGPFGREISATMQVAMPDGTPALSMLRFIGIDGPRWFLRGVLSGEAAQVADRAVMLESIFRGVVVRRGDQAMAPRSPLPLTMPPQLSATVEQAAAEQTASTDAQSPPATPAVSAEAEPTSYDDLNLFERGPEITEIR